MNYKDHSIQKQILDFEFATKNSAVQWQRNVSFRYQYEYAKMISSILDEYEDGNYHYIEKLEIQLGRVAEKEVATTIRKALDKALRKRIERPSVEALKLGSLTAIEQGTVTARKGEKELLLMLFDHFLNYGFFPWKAPMISVADLEVQLIEHFTNKSLTSFIITNQIFENLNAKKRIYLQFSKSFAYNILREYFQTDINSLLIIDRAIQRIWTTDPGLQTSRAKPQNDAEEHILRWIALVASLNTENWPIEFIKWTLENQGSKKSQGAAVKIWQQLSKKDFHGKNKDEIELILRRILSAPGISTLEGKDRIEDEQRLSADLKDADTETKESAKKKVLAEKQVDVETPDLSKGKKLSKLKDTTKGKNGKEQGKKHKMSAADLKRTETSFAPNENLDKGIQHTKEIKNDHSSGANDALAKKPEPKDRLKSKSGEPLSSRQKDFKGEEETGKLILPSPIDNETGNTYQEDGGEIQAEEQELLPSAEGCYVTLSGLILTWPYLSRLFGKLEYTRDDVFISKDKRERAVLLLGFIATGKAANEEPYLILPKFLCGWPIQMPVMSDAGLTKEEIDEANGMLNSLIQNWKILKNTSIEGLRETFFEREGKLEDQEDHWKLTVEQKGTDILLDHLPYGRSIIKLPWLKKMLKVDWA